MSQDARPRVVVVDWARQPIGDAELVVEASGIGTAASVDYVLCESDADFSENVTNADAIIVWHNIPIRAAGIRRLKRCRAIIRNGVGYDSVDLDAARERGIPVCNVPDYGTEEVADHALALTLALCRQLFPLDAEAKKLGWHIRVGDKIRRIRDRTFGILGLGRIGTATALRAKAFGFRVAFFDPYASNGSDKALGIDRVGSLEELMRLSDIFSIHTPLTPETHHMIQAQELAWLKPSAFVINTARGAVIKKEDIFAALREGRIAGAGLDVVEDEPLKTIQEASTPNLIVTCHAAFCSVESKLEMRATSARIARAAVLGEKLENIVNGL
jgi:phosphoglycerate dehydrogenase-like enzyme